MKNRKQKDNFLPSNIEYYPGSSVLDSSIEFSESNPFDLSKLNLLQLETTLSRFMDKEPSRFIFFRNRENKKIKIEIEHVGLLQQHISELRGLGKEILELRADAIVSNQMLQYLIAGRLLEFKNAIEIKIEEHKTQMHLEKAKRENSDLDTLDKRVDIALKQAEINLKEATTTEQIHNAELMKEIAADFKNLPTGAKMLVIHEYMNKNKDNTNPTEIQDFDFNEFFKDYRKKILDESLEQEKAKTTSSKAQADFDKYKTDRKTGKI